MSFHALTWSFSVDLCFVTLGLHGDHDCCLNLVTVTKSAVLMSLGQCGTALLSVRTLSCLALLSCSALGSSSFIKQFYLVAPWHEVSPNLYHNNLHPCYSIREHYLSHNVTWSLENTVIKHTCALFRCMDYYFTSLQAFLWCMGCLPNKKLFNPFSFIRPFHHLLLLHTAWTCL